MLQHLLISPERLRQARHARFCPPAAAPRWAGARLVAMSLALWGGVLLAGWLWPASSAPAVGRVAWLTALVLAPSLEEVVFRLGLQQELQRRELAPWAVVLITALAFALAHLAVQGTPAAAATLVPALLIGAVYRWSQHRHASLWPCIALHALFNLASWHLPLLR